MTMSMRCGNLGRQAHFHVSFPEHIWCLMQTCFTLSPGDEHLRPAPVGWEANSRRVDAKL